MAVFPRAANALVKVLMLASSTRAFTSCVRSSSRGGYQHTLNSDTVQTWVNNDLHLRQKLDSPENFRGQNAFIFKLPFMFVSSSSGTFFTKRYMTSSSPSSEQDSVVSTCRKKICAALETDKVKVIGAFDDPNGSHISIEVVSTLFEGKRLMQRQQMVYKAIWEEMQGRVHAVDSMVCKTPGEV